MLKQAGPSRIVVVAGVVLGLSGSVAMADSGSGELPLADIETIASEAYDAGELEEAILFWSAAAKRGSVSAMVSLAVTYQEVGDDGDRERAEMWYRAAAEQNDVFAMVSLADILMAKSPPETGEALALLERAAAAGNDLANRRLGALTSGTPKN